MILQPKLIRHPLAKQHSSSVCEVGGAIDDEHSEDVQSELHAPGRGE